ncbi:MAG: ATP-dependent Clp protease ATP-binding subunit [Candidatus Falkowbacteria bacterium]
MDNQPPILFWGLALSRSSIALKRLKAKFDVAVNLISALIAFGGMASLVYWVYLHQDWILVSPLNFLSFYKESSPWLLLFFISIIFDMFLYYRSSENEANKFKINRRTHKKKIDISSGLSDYSLKFVEDAYLLASKLKQKEVTARHIFRAVLTDKKIKSLLIRLDVDLPTLVDKLKNYLAENNDSGEKLLGFSEVAKNALTKSYEQAWNEGRVSIDALDLFMFAYGQDELIQEILYDQEITDNKIANAIKWFRVNEQMQSNYKIYRKMARLKPGSGMNRAYTAVATPTLDYYSHDMTLMAKYGYLEICVAREKEIKAIFEAMESGHSGVLLVGPVGVGKRSIVEGLAQLMVKEEVPVFLKDKRLVELDISRLVGGTSPAEAQERLLAVMGEAMHSKNVVLFIDNIETIVGISSGGEGSLELSEVLSDALSRQNIFCLACASSENYSKYIEEKSLGEIMTTVGVSEPTHDQAIQMLESKVGFFEGKYNVYINYHAVEQAVDLSSRYINDKFLPEKAINIMQLTAVKVSKSTKGQGFCSQDDIAFVISEQTGIPVSKVSESETQKLLSLEDSIHARMIGQEEAVIAISGSLRRARAELRESKRPIASFLFLGPTGVGKTELAKTVAEVYFGDENYMIRLDMSEYQLADSVKKMIGDSTSGSLGYLTEAVRKKPFSLVLLDEVEKAHPDVLNLFLQMMDDGRLTDGQGRTINFTNSIIVATSNAGALYIEEAVSKGVDMNIIKQELIDNQLNKIMRPELINRFDGVIVFKPLSFDNVVSVAKLMLKKIGKNLEPKGIELVASEAGVKELARQGYDPKFGARPLRRLLQDKTENQIANLFLAKSIKRRDTIVIDEEGNVQVEKGRVL